MKKVMVLLITVMLVACNCEAQLYVEPVIGFQTDVTNSNHFKQFNAAIQFGLKKSKYYELMFRFQVSLPASFFSHDSSFSQNLSSPVYSSAKKTLRATALCISVGNRLPMIGRTTRNIFSLIAYSGLSYQKITATYQYDKSNYTILNPDKSQKRTGLYLSCGIEYMRLLKNGRVFTQLSIGTPPIGEKINYPSSFSFIAPLSFNAGYSLPLKRNKHEK